ncbi:MAG: hypothetical protein HZA91_09955 [Verrucomicrobia bacterium]|nr:hypothetical protein [Verrucomicrobiota bacterium]
MDIYFKCIHCDQRLVVDDAGVGLEIPCPGCGKLVAIPERSTVPSDADLTAEKKVAEKPLVMATPVAPPSPPAVAEAPPKPPAPPRPPARVRPPPGLLSRPRAIQPARLLAAEPAEAPPRPVAPPRPAAPLSPLAPPHAVPVARESSGQEALALFVDGLQSPPAPRRVAMPPAVAGKPSEPPQAAPLPESVLQSLSPPPPPPPAPVVIQTPKPIVPVIPEPIAVASPIVPPLDLAFPDVGLAPVEKPKPPVVAAPLPVRVVAPEPLPVSPTPLKVAPAPAPKPVPLPVVPAAQAAVGAVRLVDTDAARRATAEKWQELANALAQQLWSGKTTYPFRAVMVETFLRAMPVLLMNPNVVVSPRGAQAGMSARWLEPFTLGSSEHVARLGKGTFEGSTARVAEVVELWMHHQQMMAERAGSNIEDISFSMTTLPQSAVVTFGMNFNQRGTGGRKRVACWVGRIGDDLFVFSGKLPPQGARVPLGAERAFRAGDAAPEPSVQIPREKILALPPPEGMEAAAARTMRELVINFCEAHFGRFDNRLAGEFYDGIRQDRDAARAALPDVITAMPPSKEKRMLQQLYRDL